MARGIGRIYQPSYRDSRTREKKKVTVWWIRFGCRRTCGKPECSGVHQENSRSDNRRVAERLLRKRLGEVGVAASLRRKSTARRSRTWRE